MIDLNEYAEKTRKCRRNLIDAHRTGKFVRNAWSAYRAAVDNEWFATKMVTDAEFRDARTKGMETSMNEWVRQGGGYD